MDTTHLFIEPVDTLFLRGNKLFGDPGSFGESLVPPWPSVAAGALRSALLVHRGHDPAGFVRGEVDDPELGTPRRPGSFAITRFQIARRHADGTVEPLYGIPADLSVRRREDGNGRGGDCEIRRIQPHAPPNGVHASAATASLAVLAEQRRGKPLSGRWLTAGGWREYVEGGDIDPEKHLVSSDVLWTLDTRIGIALDSARRRAADGALFSSQGVVFRKRGHSRAGDTAGMPSGCDVGFIAEVSGAMLPEEALMLRFGGDGRAALATRVEVREPEADYDGTAEARRCRLILTTPGLFEGGWRPTGVTGSGRDLRFELHGVRARLVCAAAPRAEVVSGFDIAEGRPKPAQRVAPTGSVYWLDELDASAEDLRRLAGHGLWSDPAENRARRAEGFNRVTFGAYRH